MKRQDLEVGKWYYNPMMESHGVTKVKYIKISELDTDRFPGCNVIQYDEGVTSDGRHLKFKSHVTQSNDSFETEMKEVDEKEVKLFITSKKYGL